MDDDLTNQLRSLGEAAEKATRAVSAHELTDSDLPNTNIAVDQGSTATAKTRGGASREIRPAHAVLIAATIAMLFIGVGFVIRSARESNDSPPRLETAAQGQGQRQGDGSTPTFAVPAADNGWSELRTCESTGDYGIDTGNSFYGAYQFTWRTFNDTAETLGLADYVSTNPALAPPEIQDAVANAMYLERGDEPWPVCDRFIDGPMITPVVPQWISQYGAAGAKVVVFANPDIDEDGLDDIRAELRRVLGTMAEQTIRFVDRQEAYEEFQQMFDDNEQVANSVEVDDMPPSFRIRTDIPELRLAGLRGIEGVFEVVTADPTVSLNPPLPLKMIIPAIDLRSPIYGSATVDNLAKGPSVIAGNVRTPFIAGYGSVEGAVFERLDELREGHQIEISSLVADPRSADPFQIVRTYEVVGAPGISELDELPAWPDVALDGLTLVSDVADEPTQRLVVRARAVPPSLASFGQRSIGPIDE